MVLISKILFENEQILYKLITNASEQIKINTETASKVDFRVIINTHQKVRYRIATFVFASACLKYLVSLVLDQSLLMR